LQGIIVGKTVIAANQVHIAALGFHVKQKSVIRFEKYFAWFGDIIGLLSAIPADAESASRAMMHFCSEQSEQRTSVGKLTVIRRPPEFIGGAVQQKSERKCPFPSQL